MICRFCPALLALAIVAAIAALPEAAVRLARSSNSLAPNHFQASPAQAPADLILTDARIETMDPAHEWAGAVAIRGESIVAVSYVIPGSAEAQDAGSADVSDLKPWLGPNTRIITLHGA
ncbi:MAG: hypothetical protein WB470_14400, partial [Candidatus Acidiferrales bacterium]